MGAGIRRLGAEGGRGLLSSTTSAQKHNAIVWRPAAQGARRSARTRAYKVVESDSPLITSSDLFGSSASEPLVEAAPEPEIAVDTPEPIDVPSLSTEAVTAPEPSNDVPDAFEAMQDAAQSAQEQAAGFGSSAGEALSDAAEAFTDAATETVSGAEAAIENAAETVTDFFSGISESVSEGFSNLVSGGNEETAVPEAPAAPLSEISDRVENSIVEPVTVPEAETTNSFFNSIKEAISVPEPSSVDAPVAIEAAQDTAQDAAQEQAAGFASSAGEALSDAAEAVTEAFEEAEAAIENAVTDFFSGISESVSEGFSNLVSGGNEETAVPEAPAAALSDISDRVESSIVEPVTVPETESTNSFFETIKEAVGVPEPSNDVPAAIEATQDAAQEQASGFASGAGEALSDAAEAVTDALEGAEEALENAAGSVVTFFSGISESVTEGISDLVSGGNDETAVPEAPAAALSDISDRVESSIIEPVTVPETAATTPEPFTAIPEPAVTTSAPAALPDLTQSVPSAANAEVTGRAVEAVQGAQDAVSGVGSKITGVISGATGAVTDKVSATTSAVTGGVTDALNGVAASINNSTSALVQEVESVVGGVRDQAWAAIPPPAQGILSQVGEVAGAAANLVAQYPIPTLGITSAVVANIAYKRYQARYGGYAGEIDAASTAILLNTEEEEGEQPALLLDIRPDSVREQEGLPELKLRARFKAVALPIAVARSVALGETLPASTLKLIPERDELVLDVHAALVAGLKKTPSPLTKVIVMDRVATNSARQVARALRRNGLYSAYVMEDGFEGWQAAGLPVTNERGIDYDASTIDLINDNLEVVAEQTKDLISRLRDPAVAVPVATTTAVGAVALYYYHYTLQLIGLGGLSWSLYRELAQYNSPQEMLETYKARLRKLGPKPKPRIVNGVEVPDDWVPPSMPAPAAAARAEEVLAKAAAEAAEEAAARKAAQQAAAAVASAKAKQQQEAEAAAKAKAAAAAEKKAEQKPAPAAAAPAAAAATTAAVAAAATAAPKELPKTPEQPAVKPQGKQDAKPTTTNASEKPSATSSSADKKQDTKPAAAQPAVTAQKAAAPAAKDATAKSTPAKAAEPPKPALTAKAAAEKPQAKEATKAPAVTPKKDDNKPVAASSNPKPVAPAAPVASSGQKPTDSAAVKHSTQQQSGSDVKSSKGSIKNDTQAKLQQTQESSTVERVRQ